MPKTEVAQGEHSFEVVGIARVEGEGTLRLRITDGEVSEARLSIFEAPRYFEKILVGDDPSLLASMASQMPEPPPFVELDRESLAHELQAERQMAEAAERGETAPANAPDAPKEKLPDHWWLDSPSKLSARKKDENPG